MKYQQKKADPVGIGLLKEGDDAYCIFYSRPFLEQTLMNSLFCVSIYIDAELPKKLQFFPKFIEILLKLASYNKNALF